MSHVLEPIAKAFQHEVGLGFGTAVVWNSRIIVRIL